MIRLSFYCMKVTFSFSKLTAPLCFYCWCYIFEYPVSDDAPVFSISEVRHAVSQQRQSVAKRNNAAPHLIWTFPLADLKTPSLFFYSLYINQEWHKLSLLSMKFPFKICIRDGTNRFSSKDKIDPWATLMLTPWRDMDVVLDFSLNLKAAHLSSLQQRLY